MRPIAATETTHLAILDCSFGFL